MKRSLLLLTLAGLLPGCEVVEAILNGLGALKAQPQFALARVVPIAGGSPGDLTVEVRLGTVTAPGRAHLFGPIRPKPTAYTHEPRLLWDGTGARLAVALREEFFGGFDDWIYVYDVNENEEFFGSDDTMGTAMSTGCAPLDAPSLQAAADQSIAEGFIPAGSVAKMRPGTGIIQGAGLTGWLSPRAFAMTLYHEPRVFALAPDGTEHDLAVLTGSPTLGAFVTISAVFTKAGSGWTASGCALVPPAIPARPAPHPAVTVDASGRLRADGVALNDQTGAAIGGVEAADGSY
ncbi:MAG: hypothetical protein KDE00_07220 [Rhodobacteraceae bacterium]|nr:hypothetical protein [Paracoccaceae bacterium]